MNQLTFRAPGSTKAIPITVQRGQRLAEVLDKSGLVGYTVFDVRSGEELNPDTDLSKFPNGLQFGIAKRAEWGLE